MDLKEAIATIESAMSTVKITDEYWAIVVLDRGFVFVGMLSEQDGLFTLKRAATIRRWGTTRGLGEIQPGPTDETVLDPHPEPLHFTSYIIALEASKEGWSNAY